MPPRSESPSDFLRVTNVDGTIVRNADGEPTGWRHVVIGLADGREILLAFSPSRADLLGDFLSMAPAGAPKCSKESAPEHDRRGHAAGSLKPRWLDGDFADYQDQLASMAEIARRRGYASGTTIAGLFRRHYGTAYTDLAKERRGGGTPQRPAWLEDAWEAYQAGDGVSAIAERLHLCQQHVAKMFKDWIGEPYTKLSRSRRGRGRKSKGVAA